MLARFNSRNLLFTTATLLGMAGLAAQAAGPSAIQRVSVSPIGVEGNGDTGSDPAISADGRFVVFSTQATNFWGNEADQNGFADIYIRDRKAGFTEFGSIADNPAGGVLDNYLNDADSANPAISADGRYIAFTSTGSKLVSGGPTAGDRQVYVRDRRGFTFIASQASGTAGAIGTGDSDHPALSGDGFTVAYSSDADTLVANDKNGFADVFATQVTITPPAFGVGKPTVNRVTTRISQPVTAPGQTAVEANGASGSPQVSLNGRYVTFSSAASNLVAGDSNGKSDIFIKDLATGALELVSVSTSGKQADGDSIESSVSADGRFVVFSSDATNLDAGDTNAKSDVFVRDRLNQTTQRISVAVDGTEGDDDSGLGSNHPRISADGRFVVFGSAADNLVADDLNGKDDIFLYDLQNSVIQRMSVAAGDVEADGGSSSPAISADGSTILFVSDASNLAADKTNDFQDAYVVGNPFFTGGGIGGGGNQAPEISIDAPVEVFEQDQVTLDASGTTDAENDKLTYQWTVVRAPRSTDPVVTLTGANTATPQFIAPQVVDSTDYTFQVTVSDGTNTALGSTTVTVSPAIPGVLTGRVTDSQGNAIAGALVHVQRGDGAEATDTETDGVGGYIVDDVRVGHNTVTIIAPDELNLEPAVASFDVNLVNGAGDTVHKDFVMASSAASISGVVQLANGQPVVGATVELVNGQGEVLSSADTDDAGEYRVQNISSAAAAGQLSLRLTGKGILPWTVSNLGISAGSANTRNFRYGTLAVTVDGTPARVRKQLDGTRVELLVNGQVTAVGTVTKKVRKFTFTNVPGITVRVRASNSRLTGAVQDVTVTQGPGVTSTTIFLRPRGIF